jgi:hypothetical protein
VGDIIPPSTALAFVTKMSKKCKFTAHGASQVKNQQKTVSIEERLGAVCQLRNGE